MGKRSGSCGPAGVVGDRESPYLFEAAPLRTARAGGLKTLSKDSFPNTSGALLLDDGQCTHLDLIGVLEQEENPSECS